MSKQQSENLRSAKLSIQAELVHAKEGRDYYQAKMDSLESMLAKIDDLGGAPSGISAKAPIGTNHADDSEGVGRKPKKTNVKKAKSTKTSDSKKTSQELPRTSEEFWTSIMTDQPKSTTDVLASAISKIGFEPNADQKKKLAQRMTFALNALVRSGKIKDSGAGRDRRFFQK